LLFWHHFDRLCIRDRCSYIKLLCHVIFSLFGLKVNRTFLAFCVGFPSCQLVVVVMGFLGILCSLLNRVNLSVALLRMVNATYVRSVELNGANSSHETSACFGVENVTTDTKVWLICGKKVTRNSLDCDQSNYSSRIVFAHIPIEFGQTGITAIRSADPENPTVEPNISGSDDPSRRYGHLKFSQMWGRWSVGRHYILLRTLISYTPLRY